MDKNIKRLGLLRAQHRVAPYNSERAVAGDLLCEMSALKEEIETELRQARDPRILVDARLWIADAHKYGPGKTHTFSSEDPIKTECGRFIDATPGREGRGKITCQSCCNRVMARKERAVWDEVYKLEETHYQQLRAEQNTNWWSEYDSYLQTPEWKARRQKVLERAHYMCEGCGERIATQAHHLTYNHLKNEPLFDLRAVCEPCHMSITAMDRARRASR